MIMRHNDLKRQVIHHLAEQGIPADYDPWVEINMQLERNQTGRKTTRQPGMTAPMKINLRGLAALLVLLVGVVFFLTPQGQVTAQNIFQFFRRAQSNVLPLPAGLPTEPILPTKTPVPMRVAGLQPVPSGEPNAFFTPTPSGRTILGTTTSGLTISGAEELAKYAIRVPKTLPSGYRLAEVMFDSQTQTVQQIYKYFPYQSGELFVLSQGPSQPAETIGQSAEINQIQVGDIPVESVSGTWLNELGSDVEEWVTGVPVQTFRWRQDGFYFALNIRVDDRFSPAYLSEDDMRALLEVIMGIRSALPEDINLNNLTSVEEAEKAAGFHLLAPAFIPEGFTLERVVYEPDNKRAVLIYRPKDTAGSMNNPSLVIYEILKSRETPSTAFQEELPPEAIEQVMIGIASGTYRRGAIENGVYDPDSGLSLSWETNDLCVNINYFNSSSHPSRLDKTDMIKIAEGLQ
jgi:hypothetical protein